MRIKTFFISIVLGMVVAGGMGAFSSTTASIGESFSNSSIILVNQGEHHKHHKRHHHKHHNVSKQFKAYYCPKQPHARDCMKFCQHNVCHR